MQHPDLTYDIMKSMRMKSSTRTFPVGQRPAADVIGTLRATFERRLAMVRHRIDRAPAAGLRASHPVDCAGIQPCA